MPTLDKTWSDTNKLVNQLIAGSGTVLTDHRAVLLAVKESLIGFTDFPLAVEASSDSSAADATDRWDAIGKLVWAAGGAAHSWIQLSQAATGMELVIDCTPLDSGVQGPRLTIVMSPSAGFTGGSTTARPTATDEIVLLNGAQWLGTSAASPSFSAVVHAIQSDDGEAARVLVHIANVPVFFMSLELAQDPLAGWTAPNVLGWCLGATSPSDSVLTYGKLYSVPIVRARVNDVSISGYLATESYAGEPAGARVIVPGDVSELWPFYSMAVVSETAPVREPRLTGVTPGERGIWDIWFMSATKGIPADTFPDDGTTAFAQFGVVAMPWKASTPPQTA
jgi:hypothetical protein